MLLFLLRSGYAVPHEWLGTLDATATDVVKVRSSVVLCTVAVAVAVQCCTMSCCAVSCCPVLCCAVLCCAVLYCAVLCCAVPGCSVVSSFGTFWIVKYLHQNSISIPLFVNPIVHIKL